jgi:hypothetical protein
LVHWKDSVLRRAVGEDRWVVATLQLGPNANAAT